MATIGARLGAGRPGYKVKGEQLQRLDIGYGANVACFGWAARTLGHGGAVMRRQAALDSRSMNILSG